MEIPEAAAVGFGAAADAYERARPGYPREVADVLRRELGLGPGARVLDLAAGTGKLTRLLVEAGAHVVAVEPVAAMRERLPDALPGVEVLAGTAEAVPLDDAADDVVTVGQAFHWFRRDEALAEIARVLRPGGGLAMVWNVRDESVPWVAELTALIREGRDVPYEEATDWVAVVAASGRYTPLQLRRFRHEHLVDADTLVDRVLSTSFLAVLPADDQRVVAERVRDLVACFPPTFPLPYRSSLHWCRVR